jgi:hypothetical protein
MLRVSSRRRCFPKHSPRARECKRTANPPSKPCSRLSVWGEMHGKRWRSTARLGGRKKTITGVFISRLHPSFRLQRGAKQTTVCLTWMPHRRTTNPHRLPRGNGPVNPSFDLQLLSAISASGFAIPDRRTTRRLDWGQSVTGRQAISMTIHSPSLSFRQGAVPRHQRLAKDDRFARSARKGVAQRSTLVEAARHAGPTEHTLFGRSRLRVQPKLGEACVSRVTRSVPTPTFSFPAASMSHFEPARATRTVEATSTVR